MKLGWVTDPHLNFVAFEERARFYHRVVSERLDALLLGGDIGEADTVDHFLTELEITLRIPIYFVLGNHDFYRGSMRGVREDVARQAAASQWLHWLPASGVVRLTDRAALVGHDGWADGRVGDFFRSEVMLNDYVLIEELRFPSKRQLYEKLNALGDEAAAFLDAQVREALAHYRDVIVLTHVPPFREACWHEGRISDDGYLPHFACEAVGDRLAAIMRENPNRKMTVLCGHTHGAGEARILENLVVHTGGVVYGRPAIQRVWDVA